MKLGQRLLDENGVEVALYPDTVVQYAPHTDYVAYDLNGKHLNVLYAPTTLTVAKNDPTSAYHSVYFWCYGRTPSGVIPFTILAMHSNDVSDIPKGTKRQQGELIYTEGGFGPNGPKSYASHIHIQVAKGHVAKTVANSAGKWSLVNACPMNEIFFVNDTPIITQGLAWQTYELPKPKPEAVVDVGQQVETSPISDPIAQYSLENVQETVLTVTETPMETPQVSTVDETPVLTKPQTDAQTETPVWTPTPTVQPIESVETIVEQTPSNNTTETQTTPKTPVNGLYAIIVWLIRLFVMILGKKHDGTTEPNKTDP